MSIPFELTQTADIVWRDGRPFSIDFDDIYFSVAGGLEEAQHVFIDGNQLITRWQSLSLNKPSQFVIAETGFGSGLNFLLTWALWNKQAPPSARLHYFSSEKHPLTRTDLERCMTLWPTLAEPSKRLLDLYPVLTPGFHVLKFEEGRITLTLMLGDSLRCYQELLLCGERLMERQLREYTIDAWFLDGFSPAKNPAMWSQSLFTTIAMLSGPHTTLATFSSAGIVKEGLRASGFKVTKKPGHGRKREMVVADFESLPPIHTTKHTPWHVNAPKSLQAKRAIVLGAGLAGCYMAHALARRGWSVRLLDAEKNIACGASGNQQAILYPKLTSFSSPLNNFMLSAFLFAFYRYQDFINQGVIGELSGILQLAYHEKENASQNNLQAFLKRYPELGILVSQDIASTLAGLALQSEGIFIPRSGWLDSPALCQFLAAAPGIDWIGDTTVNLITHEDGKWHANEHSAEVLVLANGYAACGFEQTKHIPIKTVRGQMTSMLSTEMSARLKIPVCADVHILPSQRGSHALGTSYHPDSSDTACYAVDDEQNMAALNSISTDEGLWSQVVTGHWSGVRASTLDYLPLVGPVVKADSFREQFRDLISDKNRWIKETALHHDGLYIFAGFGSRGLTTIPLSGEWLASLINKEPSGLPCGMIQSISPSRFLRRDLIQGKIILC